MRFSSITAIVVGLACPALAQDPLDAEGFDQHTVGRIFSFTYGEEPYGTELYLPGQQVIWIEDDGTCWEGHWFQSGSSICFRYQGLQQQTCSVFYPEGKNMYLIPDNPDDPPHLAQLSTSVLPNQCNTPMS